MEILVIGVFALMAIATATAVSPKVGIAAPLILVALGFGASLLPFMPAVEVDPEVILAGVLPPLLFAAGASIPATDFRREFRSISGLSVILTILSTLVLGAFFHWLIDDLSWPWAFALGAIVSPSDPVATAIIKRLGVSPRMVSLLEGESLLNDACALVLLRGAVAAAAAAVTVGDIALEFILAMTVAVIIGIIVGRLNLWVSNRMSDTTANTVFTLAVPFVASIPAEAVGASGLVAAVVCGLVTGNGSAKALSPQVRQSDAQTWHAIEPHPRRRRLSHRGPRDCRCGARGPGEARGRRVRLRGGDGDHRAGTDPARALHRAVARGAGSPGEASRRVASAPRGPPRAPG
ncbi:cation:proton antiporter [Demequina litorisediminis]|uniref:Cation/H+ exchanger transmembrane domain-containing protein n=1 Tax=Demequina litorisediminis TaxID=1849022 RepID=A0ABQ6IHE9_9MICO|nr:sodium:proton antiporter [Demequina litorisediminis]GMA37299.1 hypothetical protein GCM10025876_35030 [Demequina litorisediminis]